MAKVLDCFRDEANTYVVSELCMGEDLFERLMDLPNIDEHTVAMILKQMVEALSACWEKGNYRKVLRPESFKFDSREENAVLKLVDFGFSRLFEDQSNSPLTLDKDGPMKPYNNVSTV